MYIYIYIYMYIYIYIYIFYWPPNAHHELVVVCARGAS